MARRSTNIDTPVSTGRQTDDALVRDTLRDICGDREAPAAARAQAARTLAELGGMLGRHQDKPSTSKPLASMTAIELREELARLQGL